MRVLVVEDDEGIAQGLRAHLRQLGHAADICDTVAAGWHALQSEAFDLLLLDLGLPDGDGTTLLAKLRIPRNPAALPDSKMPVIVMTARDEVSMRIKALDGGADDYVVKPFDRDELAARMRALRRRSQGRAVSRLDLDDSVTIEPDSRKVFWNGEPVELSSKEFDILLALAEARPRVLSRTQLEARTYDWDSGPGSNVVEVLIHKLRRKLGDSVIRTVRGVGYFVPGSHE